MSGGPSLEDGTDSGNKRKVTSEIDRPKKKAGVAKAEEENTVGASSIAAVPSSSSYNLILEWSNYDVATDDFIHQSISVDEMMTRGIGLGETRAAKECKKGENHERYYSLKLIDKTKDDKAQELASLNFEWWADSSQAHLMGFNQKSQDLADFCRMLWPAAGRDSEEYSAMAIEFGDSHHSGVEVNELIADALDCDYETPETTYLDMGRGHRTMTNEHGIRLMEGLLALVGETSNVITHASDVQKLHMGADELKRFDLVPLQRNSTTGWYVRSAAFEE